MNKTMSTMKSIGFEKWRNLTSGQKALAIKGLPYETVEEEKINISNQDELNLGEPQDNEGLEPEIMNPILDEDEDLDLGSAGDDLFTDEDELEEELEKQEDELGTDENELNITLDSSNE